MQLKIQMIASGAGALSMLVATAALAQQRGTPAAGREPRQHAAGEDRVAQETRDLAAVLRIQPPQQALLRDFVAASARPSMHDRPDFPSRDALTMPQMLDEMAALEARHEQRFARRMQAARALYASLSPEQREVLDATMRLRRTPRPGGLGHVRLYDGPPPDVAPPHP